jgi:hypothetical protein
LRVSKPASIEPPAAPGLRMPTRASRRRRSLAMLSLIALAMV